MPEHGKGNSQPSPGSTESPRKEKSKEEHAKIDIAIKLTRIKDRKVLKTTREK